MMHRLHHPLWTHLPALACVAALAWAFVAYRPWPESIGLHFGADGRPDRYGSPWELLLWAMLFPCFFIIGSVVLDEIWARQEPRKRFNYLALTDELIVGLMAGVIVRQLELASKGDIDIVLPWRAGLLAALAAAAAAVIMELLRPHRPAPTPEIEHESPERLAALIDRIRSDQQWAYWESQAPFYVYALFGSISALAVVMAGLLSISLPVRIVIFAGGIAVLLVGGGFRVTVTADRLMVRMGLIALPVLRLKLADIREAEIHDFAPLVNFGGWGIRWNGRIWAYYWRGRTGVKLLTARGREFLIGSDRPERLAAVVRAAIAAQPA